MNDQLLHFSLAEIKVRQAINDLLARALGDQFRADLISIDYPPANISGDYTVPCFLLAEFLKQPPAATAKSLAAKIKPNKLIDRLEAAGPYLNFFVVPTEFVQLVLTEIYKTKKKFGQAKIGKGKKVMVEYFSPNTNKPLTVGHLRNICLGSSLVKLLNFFGYQVIDSTLYNDRGIAVAKTILGYQKWGQNQTPKDANLKPDHFVGSFYVRFSQESKINPNLEKEALAILQAWEKENKAVRQVWQKLMHWVLTGFKQTLAAVGIKDFTEEYYESEYYQLGKEIVEKGLKQGIFIKDQDGVILAPLKNYGLPDKVVLRPDDTSLYITQDFYLASLKNRHQLDQSIYVVGAEQELYFKQLFKILELLSFANAKNYYHLSYGMMRLPSGKIKSREGLIKGTGADELLVELKDLASQEIKKRQNDLSQKELEKRAGDIALGALKFYILTVSPKTTMIFEPKKSLAFTGRTGPYLQYVNARIASIFVKGKIKPSLKIDFSVLQNKLELDLVKLLARFPGVLAKAISQYDPSQLANYLYDLAKTFSLFYEQLPILPAEDKIKKARLFLIKDVQIVLENGLNLLGIPVSEKM